MTKDNATSIAEIFAQLRILREAVIRLGGIDMVEVDTLAGNQTEDVGGAVFLSFQKLQGQIAAMEETLATIAEATGEIPKR